MKYLRVPREITLADFRAKGSSLSAAMYQRVEILNPNVKTIRELIHGYDKGYDPGSRHYVKKSTHYFIRTKALQTHSWLLYPKGGAITPISPKVFEELALKDGDILMSKDSNIGECAMVHGDGWGNHMLSGGVVRIRPKIDRHYLLAFMKHELFRTELVARVPRGSTIAHANEHWLDCRVPFPSQEGAAEVIAYVSALAQAIVDKEIAIRAKDAEIFDGIDWHISKNQGAKPFVYAFPTSHEVRATGRMDTGIYCKGFKAFRHCVDNYEHGPTTLSAMGVKTRRGQNLAVSVLGLSQYSDDPKSGWYELIRPVNISEYGTLEAREWLGTPKKLQTLEKGDLILGCEGFEKGRSIVLIDAPDRCVTNFHGTILSMPGAELWQTIFVRCFLSFLRQHGVIDWVGVGGSGGHMSPDYFDYLPFPNFPDAVQQDVARLYHNPAPQPPSPLALSNFVGWHREWNESLGIWELDRELKALQKKLAAVQEDIIEGRTVTLSF